MSTITRTCTAALASGILALSLTACATGDDMSGATPSEPSASDSASPSSAPAEVSDARWDAILTDLENRGVGGEPVVVTSEQVSWPDGSLGCPQPGMSYVQVVVEGMQVVVEVDGENYDYRFGDDDRALLCEQ